MTPPGDAGKDWTRLAKHVVERRVALGLRQQDVRSAGGPSTATMRLIEGALQDSYKPHLLGSLERALRWGAGSVSQILGGGDPTPAEEPIPERPLTRVERARALIEFARTDPMFKDDKSIALILIAKAEEAIREEGERPGTTEVG